MLVDREDTAPVRASPDALHLSIFTLYDCSTNHTTANADTHPLSLRVPPRSAQRGKVRPSYVHASTFPRPSRQILHGLPKAQELFGEKT